MKYEEISKKTIGYLYQSYATLNDSPLSPAIRALVELRVSQINGCEYCCQMHKVDAEKLGITQEKLDQLAMWSTAKEFSEKERLALNLSETITLSIDKAKAQIENLSKFFSEREIVDLCICISLMNALNRIAISLRDESS